MCSPFCYAAGIIFQCLVPECGGGASACKALRWQDLSALWTLPISRGGGGYRSYLSETVLPQEHGYGLASEECYVSAFTRSAQSIAVSTRGFLGIHLQDYAAYFVYDMLSHP